MPAMSDPTPRLDYSPTRATKDSSVRAGVCIAVKAVGFLLIAWGTWFILAVLCDAVGLVVTRNLQLSYLGSYLTQLAPSASSHVSEILLGVAMLLFGDRIAGWLMPRR